MQVLIQSQTVRESRQQAEELLIRDWHKADNNQEVIQSLRADFIVLKISSIVTQSRYVQRALLRVQSL